MVSYLLLTLALIGTLASTVFLGLAIVAAMRHMRWKTKQQAESAMLTQWPPVSVLKPVHGMEPRLREDLESFFRIDYPEFELLFCARTRDDAALKLVEELKAAYPQVKVRIVESGAPPFSNGKVWSLVKLEEAAAHDILVISDSDVFVHPEYLREVVPPLMRPEVGVVSCLYRGFPVSGLWARLEALGMSVEMTSGCLIASMLEGVKFALGPTMETRKDVVAKFGGFAKMGDYCSDDFLLGNWASESGYQVELSTHVIDHVVLHRGWAASWAHQVRWMKSTRFSRPKGHFGTGLTFAMPFGILGLAAGVMMGNLPLGIGLLGWAIANRIIQTLVVGWGVVRDPRALSTCWLYPLRDLLGFFLWVASYGSNVIDWRGQKYRMEFGGKMTRVG